MLQYLVFVGATAQLVGISSYIIKTITGKTKPNRVSWLMWSIAPFIATAAALSDGVKLAVVPVFMSGFGPLLIFLVSFINPKSYWKLGKFDYLCGICSLFALIFWAITKDPLVAIFFAIASDGLAAIPTLTKAWHKPKTESAGIFACGLFSALTSLFAVKAWVVSEFAFPLYLIIINIMLIFSITRFKFLKLPAKNCE